MSSLTPLKPALSHRLGQETNSTDFHSSQAFPRTFWTGCYFIVIFLLTLQAVKVSVGMEIRIAQISLMAIFIALLIIDLQARRAEMRMLLVIFFFGLIFMTISSLSLYPKNKENAFLIKFLFIYPAAFYVGQRALTLLGPKGIIKVCESVLLISCLLSIFVHYYPIPGLIHVRPTHLSVALKGTFWEQGSLAFFFGLLLLTSVALRFKHEIWPSAKWIILAFYAIVVTCLVASANKTVWLAVWSSLVCVTLFNRDLFTRTIGAVTLRGKATVKRWGLRVFCGVCVSVLAMVLYNVSLEPHEQIVNAEMLQHKWESERGAVLMQGFNLIAEEPWLGLGFGAVEIATEGEGEGIGAGLGSGMIFNSYLDVWMSVGVLGFLYSMGLLITAYSRRSFSSQLIVVYLFIFANLNPVAQNEEYYVFLGLAYACVQETRKNTLSATRLS